MEDLSLHIGPRSLLAKSFERIMRFFVVVRRGGPRCLNPALFFIPSSFALVVISWFVASSCLHLFSVMALLTLVF